MSNRETAVENGEVCSLIINGSPACKSLTWHVPLETEAGELVEAS